VAEGRTWAPRMRAVARPVFASPTVTAVNLDSSRADAAQPVACYPDACFSVDNFDAAFEDLALSDPDHCYCVVLHALLDAEGPCAGAGAPPSPLCDYERVTALAAEAARARGSGGGGGASSSGGIDGSGGGGGGGGVSSSGSGGGDCGCSSSGGGGRAGGTSGGGSRPERPGSSTSGGRLEEQQQTGPPDLPAALAPIRTTSARAPGVSANGTSSAPASAEQHQHQQPRLPPPLGASSGGGSLPDGASPSAWRIGTRQRCLFAGYVSYDQIVNFIAASRGPGRGLLEALLGPSGDAARDKVVMTGPGGVGRAEVAVKRMAAGEGGDDGGGGGEGGGGSSLLQRGLRGARAVASGITKALAVEGAGGGGGAARGGGAWCVQCALMMLRLPVDHLAQEVLEGV
jgi:hypothetical protein